MPWLTDSLGKQLNVHFDFIAQLAVGLGLAEETVDS